MSEGRERNPLFFLSYAHDHASGASENVNWFFAELNNLVRELAGLRTGETAGFMDSQLQGDWSEELREAVGCCEVFVALLSPKYFRSEWCGKEWFAFSRRAPAADTSVERAIVPVVWVPWRNKAPAAVDRIQRFTVGRQREHERRIASIYSEDGLRFMVDKRDRDDAKVVLWRLANHIVDAADRNHVAVRTLKADELRNSFEEGVE